MKQTLTIGWFVGTKFLRYILLSFHSIREYYRDIESFGMECLAALQIFTVFNCVHFPLQSRCTVYISLLLQVQFNNSKVDYSFLL